MIRIAGALQQGFGIEQLIELEAQFAFVQERIGHLVLLYFLADGRPGEWALPVNRNADEVAPTLMEWERTRSTNARLIRLRLPAWRGHECLEPP
ncbi:hypothetical protein Pres01_03700 [Metapseudomonas resinovorans]|nr:hypothetical protein Pres01_03700 [Pseudomonas resinovorans]